jgi:hypothetical protein
MFVEDVKSYWQNAADIRSPSSASYFVDAMNLESDHAADACFLGGFNNTWRCTKGFWDSDDFEALGIINGFFHIECSRFMPSVTKVTNKVVSDYRFAPYS